MLDLSFQIHLRKYWDTRYNAMETSQEVTRMLKEAEQGPSSSNNGAVASKTEFPDDNE